MISENLEEEIIRWMVDDIQTHPEEAGIIGIERWHNVLKYEVYYKLTYYSGCSISKVSVHDFNDETDLLLNWIPKEIERQEFIKSLEKKVTKRAQNLIR